MRNGALTVLIWNDGLNGWIDTTSADLQGEFMNELQIFNNPKFGDVRTIEENGNVLFCGNDVAKALGYKSPKDAIMAHCKGAVKRRALTDGGEQEMSFIPEGDIYPWQRERNSRARMRSNDGFSMKCFPASARMART